MSTLVGIVGTSGSGKSTSIRTLPEQETVIINVASKPLPFKGWKNKYKEGKLSEGFNYINASDASVICQALDYINNSRPEIKYVVLDDSQYCMSFEFMEKAKEKGFDKFTSMAKNTFDIYNKSRKLRDDLVVFVLTHDEIITENFSPKRKIKTLGKMIDQTITLEGLFTVVLFTDIIKKNEGEREYVFITQNDGTTTAKSPDGMFESFYIPNDLMYVANKIKEYEQ